MYINHPTMNLICQCPINDLQNKIRSAFSDLEIRKADSRRTYNSIPNTDTTGYNSTMIGKKKTKREQRENCIEVYQPGLTNIKCKLGGRRFIETSPYHGFETRKVAFVEGRVSLLPPLKLLGEENWGYVGFTLNKRRA